jgi:hypothetical protein
MPRSAEPERFTPGLDVFDSTVTEDELVAVTLATVGRDIPEA